MLDIIEHGDFILRTVESEDLPELWKIAYDADEPEWMKWDGPYFNDPKYSLEEFLNLIGPSWVGNPSMYVVMHSAEIIGIVSWHWEDGKLQKWLDFGIVIFPTENWSRGLGTEISRLWVNHIFNEKQDLMKIGFTTWSGNHRMMKIGEKLGMKLEAQIRSVRFYEDQYYDSIKYGLLREEWLESPIFSDLNEEE